MYKFDVKFKHMKQKNDKNYYFLKVWCISRIWFIIGKIKGLILNIHNLGKWLRG